MLLSLDIFASNIVSSTTIFHHPGVGKKILATKLTKNVFCFIHKKLKDP